MYSGRTTDRLRCVCLYLCASRRQQTCDWLDAVERSLQTDVDTVESPEQLQNTRDQFQVHSADRAVSGGREGPATAVIQWSLRYMSRRACIVVTCLVVGYVWGRGEICFGVDSGNTSCVAVSCYVWFWIGDHLGKLQPQMDAFR